MIEGVWKTLSGSEVDIAEKIKKFSATKYNVHVGSDSCLCGEKFRLITTICFREPDNKYRTDIKRSGNKNIYNHRESEASRTEPSENFDTSGAGDKGEAVEEEPVATVGNASVA